MVHVTSRKGLLAASEAYADAQNWLGGWLMVAEKAVWTRLVDVRKTYPSTDYRSLLNEVVPHVIHDDAGHQRALSEVERLSGLLGEQSNTDLEDMIELLATLIEKYEQETICFSKADPVQLLTHLMESREMNQQQFAETVGLSTAHVSNVLSGTRAITVEQARKFGECFSVAPSLFLGID